MNEDRGDRIHVFSTSINEGYLGIETGSKKARKMGSFKRVLFVDKFTKNQYIS